MSWASCALGHTHWGLNGAAGLLLARDGAVLLQLRARWTHRGGTWSVPGGAIERWETQLEAALREAAEELGLDPHRIAVRGSRVALCGGWSYETVLGEPAGSIDLHDRAESAAHAWVALTDVEALPLHPAFRTAWDDPDAVLRDFVTATAT